MRGRKPKPLSLQISEGDTRKRGVRKLKEAMQRTPKSSPDLPPAPASLTDEQKKDYEAIREAVADLGLTDRADGVFLELAAIAVNEARRVKSGQGLRTALAFLSNLGCGGAASRARLALEKNDDGSKELIEMLSAPRKARAERVQ